MAARGTRNGANKLTENDVRYIRQHYQPATNTTLLANMFGINVKTVRAIVNGEIWGWLHD